MLRIGARAAKYGEISIDVTGERDNAFAQAYVRLSSLTLERGRNMSAWKG